MDIVYNTPFFIEQSDKNFKKLIKEQGPKVCRDFIDNNYISKIVSSFEFGYVIVTPKAMIGNSTRGRRELMLLGYTLFNISPDNLIMYLHLVCSKETCRGKGSILLNKIFEYCKERGINEIKINSIPDDKLIAYYKQHGFVFEKFLYMRNEIKAIAMYKNFIDEEDENHFINEPVD